MRVALLALTLLVLNWLAAGKMSTVHFEDSLGGVLPQLPDGFTSKAEAPSPTAGGDVPSSPSVGWWVAGGLLPPEASPKEPREGRAISSNPAVPLPAAETLNPLPTSGHRTQEMVVGLGTKQRVRMILMLATIIMSSSFGFCM